MSSANYTRNARDPVQLNNNIFMTGIAPTKLKLNEFKGIYDACKTVNPIINFLILSFLFWIEERYIDYKTKLAIDIAELKFHEEVDSQELDWKEGALFTETKSLTSEFLPEMRIQAPWVINNKAE